MWWPESPRSIPICKTFFWHGWPSKIPQRRPRFSRRWPRRPAHPVLSERGRGRRLTGWPREAFGRRPWARSGSILGGFRKGGNAASKSTILGWRLPNADLEALVFLIDWRGDAVKDFYRTRSMGDAEWDTLVEHNGGKGAPLTEITLAEGRALLRAALAEAQRYSRPMPREYKLAQSLIQRRILDAPAAMRWALRGISLALIYHRRRSSARMSRRSRTRDYALAWELLAPDHPRRLGVDLAAGVDALRRELKPAPRPRAEVTTAVDSDVVQGAAEATVRADGAEEATERGGRRVRQPVRERYTLHRETDGWRIANIERL